MGCHDHSGWCVSYPFLARTFVWLKKTKWKTANQCSETDAPRSGNPKNKKQNI
jgi:hypothetical protein